MVDMNMYMNAPSNGIITEVFQITKNQRYVGQYMCQVGWKGFLGRRTWLDENQQRLYGLDPTTIHVGLAETKANAIHITTPISIHVPKNTHIW